MMLPAVRCGAAPALIDYQRLLYLTAPPGYAVGKGLNQGHDGYLNVCYESERAVPGGNRTAASFNGRRRSAPLESPIADQDRYGERVLEFA